MDPAAFFSIIFVDTTLITPTNPITMNYTFYGQNGYNFTGEWKDLTLNFTVDDELVSINMTAFVSYRNSPETGLAGSIGLAQSRYNPTMNFMRLVAKETTGLTPINYQF